MAAGDPIPAADWSNVKVSSKDKALCKLIQAAVQSMPSGTATALTFAAGSETAPAFDTNGLHDMVTNNSRITVDRSGYWRFSGSYFTGAMTTPTSRTAFFRVNGATIIPPGPRDAGSTITSSIECTTTLLLVANDYVEFMGQQNSAGAVNTNVASQQSSTFEAEFLRP